MALLLLALMVFTYLYFAYLLHEWPPNLLCWDARRGFTPSLIVQSTKGKVVVCGSYVVTLLNWTPIFEW